MTFIKGIGLEMESPPQEKAQNCKIGYLHQIEDT